MNYLPKSRVKGGFLKKLIFLLGLFVVAALFFSLADRFVISLVTPLWRSENTFSQIFGKTIDFFHTQASLVEENRVLKDKIDSMELERLSTASFTVGSGSLYELLGRDRVESGVVSAVVTNPPQSPYDFLVVDAGSRDMVVMGSMVRLLEGPEVGTVVEVYPNLSKVKLFSASGEKTHGVLERNEVPVVLEGSGAGNFKIVVPRETEVEVGDRILSASLGRNLLAVAESVELKSTDSFKEVLAKSPVNIFSVRFVYIIP